MANNENLKKARGFDKMPENINREGRPKGSKNRATILKKWLEVASKYKHPETKEELEGTVEDKIALGIISKAMDGDVSAFKEIMDSIYGKHVDMIETKNVDEFQGMENDELQEYIDDNKTSTT